MCTDTNDEATTQISNLGSEVVKDRPVPHVHAAPRRLGFMDGEIEIPEDFDRMGETEIVAMFEGEP